MSLIWVSLTLAVLAYLALFVFALLYVLSSNLFFPSSILMHLSSLTFPYLVWTSLTPAYPLWSYRIVFYLVLSTYTTKTIAFLCIPIPSLSVKTNFQTTIHIHRGEGLESHGQGVCGSHVHTSTVFGPWGRAHILGSPGTTYGYISLGGEGCGSSNRFPMITFWNPETS